MPTNPLAETDEEEQRSSGSLQEPLLASEPPPPKAAPVALGPELKDLAGLTAAYAARAETVMSFERTAPAFRRCENQPEPSSSRRARARRYFVSSVSWVAMKATDTALLGHVGTRYLDATALSDLYALRRPGRDRGDAAAWDADHPGAGSRRRRGLGC